MTTTQSNSSKMSDQEIEQKALDLRKFLKKATIEGILKMKIDDEQKNLLIYMKERVLEFENEKTVNGS